MFSRVTRKLTAELLLLVRSNGNEITSLKSSVQSLQAQINNLQGQLQWHEQQGHDSAN